MPSDVTEFVRTEAGKYGLFGAFSAAAVALSRYPAAGDSLRTPGRLALAVCLVLSGSLAVVLAERCLDRCLASRGDTPRIAAAFLAVGIATLTVVFLVFYTAVSTSGV